VTNGYGLKHHIILRVVDFKGSYEYSASIKKDEKLLFTALDWNNKYNGFFSKDIGKQGDPEKLIMAPKWLYSPGIDPGHWEGGIGNMPLKAKNADQYLLTIQSPEEFPNLYTTSDFKNLTKITNLAPQQNYNWYHTKLIHWKTFDNKTGAGVFIHP